jgi:hypothetical protein
MTAVPAITVDAAHPGNAYPRAQRQRGRSAIDDLAHDLMTRNQLRQNRRQVSFNDVQVRAADAASNDPNQDVVGLELGARDLHDLKRTGWIWRDGRKYGSCHID